VIMALPQRSTRTNEVRRRAAPATRRKLSLSLSRLQRQGPVAETVAAGVGVGSRTRDQGSPGRFPVRIGSPCSRNELYSVIHHDMLATSGSRK